MVLLLLVFNSIQVILFNVFTFQYGVTITKVRYINIWYNFNIYIPIWCYYYGIKETRDGKVKKFTFQYGVTITVVSIIVATNSSLFTFQYGVTITKKD